jgi:hypothetical protein
MRITSAKSGSMIKILRGHQRVRLILNVFLTLTLIFVFSCTLRVLGLKQEEVDSWLNTISGGEAAEIDITGKWHDPQGSTFFGWGEGYLIQEQNKIRGIIGNYNIKGIVSGKIVYLVFMYRGLVYYTARLELFQDLLMGNYFKATDKKQERGYPTSFAKTVDPTIKQ